ncbi:RNA repair transcriptional activator RtcR [Persicirhabdus sediminis]|uniref:Sigma 54-interacting transcriptional regulator n=1 Tax=Persicirhabdus sediminis TaxID=454144 RepID=A0A8J7MFF8_9BACT|nr:RNA repair transcriptional activator RtcR [Persicirhabdus sediminis]MBK1790819.1 sigma 54-interacting transcriptional regulator [Persicirhabdus sediminis]
MKQRVVFGFLGTKLDRGSGPERWDKWRPNVSLCSHEDEIVHRLELFHDHHSSSLARRVKADIEQISPETTIVLNLIGIKKYWDFEDVFSQLHDFFTKYQFDQENEEYLAHMTTGTHVAQICLFLLTESRHLPGKLLQSEPPRGRDAHQPTGSNTVIDLDLSKYDQLASRFNQEQAEAQDFLKSGIATRNKKFNQLIQQIEVVALRSDAPILLTGPTGAGKSHLAGRIYELRQHRCQLDGPIVEVNCATLRGDTAMSTLFGHKKGAFTGAQNNRAGLLREAHKGLLFLDEIGELGLDEQAMLLRAIEEGTFMPVGADHQVKSQFQLIAGTNRDLRKDVSEGRFREDLLARINLWTFELPGLADRRDDIAPNLDYELSSFTNKHGRVVSFNKEAKQEFLKFAKDPAQPWRGNFRDLNAAITRMATLAPRGRIRHDEVSDEIQRLQHSWLRPNQQQQQTAQLDEFLSDKQIEQIDPFDRPQLAAVIHQCRNSKTLSEAGRALFAVSRTKKQNPNDSDRLKKYLARFGLNFNEITSQNRS